MKTPNLLVKAEMSTMKQHHDTDSDAADLDVLFEPVNLLTAVRARFQFGPAVPRRALVHAIGSRDFERLYATRQST